MSTGPLSRREFLRNTLAGGTAAVLLPQLYFKESIAAQTADPWTEVMPQILQRIKAPTFPKKDFLITRFGARPGGLTSATSSFKEATANSGVPKNIMLNCSNDGIDINRWQK